MKVTKSELAFLKQIVEELDVASQFACEKGNLMWGVSKIETVKRLIGRMVNEAEIIE